MIRILLVILALACAAPATAAPILADFRAEFSYPYTLPHRGPRVLEALAESVAGRPDLTDADEIVSPGWIGHVNVDLAHTGRIVLAAKDKISEGTGIADYQLAVFRISNIVFRSVE